MGEPSREYRPWRALARKVAPVVALYPGLFVALVLSWNTLDRLDGWWVGGSHDQLGLGRRVIDALGHGIFVFSVEAYIAVFLASIVLGPIGFALRAIARRRLRAGGADPIDRVRRWVEAHPKGTRALTFAPPALWSAYTTYLATRYVVHNTSTNASWVSNGFAMAILGILAALALERLPRAGLRALLAPTIPELDVPQRPEVPKDEITFAAVAVTLETQAAVAAMLALTAAALFAIFSPVHALGDLFMRYGLVPYVAVALGGAALFRHASQVAIGVDGVLVKGTSRTRFFAYRDLDSASAEGGDLVLARKGRVVLRLQLHGEDASKRDAVLARMREAIARVKEGRSALPAELVSTATADELARAAGGGANYRGAALTREQLWALVEGPEIEANARRAAAEALARTSDGADRARLRVAAGHCAAPEVRVAIERIADEEPADGERERELRAARG